MGGASPRRIGKALPALLLPLVVVGLLYAAYRMAPPVPAPAPAPQVAAPADAPEPGEAAALPEPRSAPQAPGFDVVRVEPDGQAAVVGTAAPGATVTIYADEMPVAEAEADAQGNFVALFAVEPSTEPRALTLGAVTPDGAASSSEDVVVLLPRAPAAPAAETAPARDVAVLSPERMGEMAGLEAAAPAEPAPAGPAPAAPAPVAPGGPAPEVAATAIVRADSVEVIPVGPADPDGRRDVTLGAVSYAEAGEVTLAGAGTAGARVRVYVDDRFAEEARVASDGRWSMQLGDVAEGIYRLRVDELAADGRVASRVETPFQRDYPRPPPPRPGVAVGRVATVTVQPGHNLWTLARTHYGSGVRYTQIFTANRDQIRNPDLIYPGQIFSIPDDAAAE